jgi:hypothetical protein
VTVKLAILPLVTVALEGLMLPPVPEEAITVNVWAEGKFPPDPPPPDPPPQLAVVSSSKAIPKRQTQPHRAATSLITQPPLLSAYLAALEITAIPPL